MLRTIRRPQKAASSGDTHGGKSRGKVVLQGAVVFSVLFVTMYVTIRWALSRHVQQ